MFTSESQGEFNIKNLLVVLFLTLFYFISGKIGLNLAFLHPSATPVWVPTGIAIAAFLIWGTKIWPGIFLGAFFVNLTTPGTILTSLVIASGNTLESVVGAFLIEKLVGKEETFFKPVNIFKYALVIIPAVSIGSTIGTTSLLLGNLVSINSFYSVWRTWFLGDVGGALIIAPLILLWANNYKWHWSYLKTIELLICLLSVTVINIIIFGGVYPAAILSPPTAFFSLPLLVWLAFRFEPRETATTTFIVFVIVILGTLGNIGPFSRIDPNESLLAIQFYMGIIFLSVMPVAAAVYQQKRVEDRLRVRSEEYKKLIDTSPDAILVSDLKGNIQVVNQRTLDMYGLQKSSEIIGRSGFDFVAPESRQKTIAALSEILKRGRVDNVEYVGVKKNGSKFYSSSNASILYNSNGIPEKIIIVSHDITRKKEIDRLKSEFVSLASHQLRTPLGSMRWSVEMLLNGDYGTLTSGIKEVVGDLYDSIIRLIKLVNDLLDVSRIEEGRFFDTPETVQIKSLLKNVIRSLTPIITKRNLKLTLKLPKERIAPILIGKAKLADVFENLLSNSIKYTKPNGRIEVKLEKAHGMVIIHFKDNGIGIPKVERVKIFSKFYRSSQIQEVEPEGTGLGLFIVKSYVEDWGGKVYFKSRVGKGSTFTVELPENPILKSSIK